MGEVKLIRDMGHYKVGDSFSGTPDQLEWLITRGYADSDKAQQGKRAGNSGDDSGNASGNSDAKRQRKSPGQ